MNGPEVSANPAEAVAETLRMHEPPAPEALLPASPHPALWAAAALTILLLALLAWFATRPKTKAPNLAAERRAARDRAAAGLQALAQAAPPPDARQAAVRASLELRRYLAVASGDPALFETHEEFITRQDSLACLDEAARAACSTGFARLAKLKYAPLETSAAGETLPTPTLLAEDCLSLLDTLHAGFRASSP